ncbi:DUF2628 domain-containing protein [Paraburkholderia sp. MMS20-SJTR3]|uniref:DUF2628 domain-containing protein n=1 Tax=Paraburkholderia sejongensis TaxID=2886946 RepID=A0ABS8JZN8_9BURK|nr:DUF2628 domain-containing protein [Paraburkholderia sp. MMS20-SJTR3]MCC8395173.1 DUF2628 domain-containing protein [Paraburkholderia sp. MMS20-SJTR3]
MGAPIYLQHPHRQQAVAVATGFSWGACLLGFIWALSKRMWFAAFVMLGINVIFLGIGLWGEAADLIGFLLSVLFAVGCGVYGNRWHRWTLEQQGYRVVDENLPGRREAGHS